jgi:hypothetical protein
METREQRRLHWTEPDVQAIKRLIEPIARRHGFVGQAIDDITQEILIVAERKCDGQEHHSPNYRNEVFSSKRIARAAKYACCCAVRIARNHRRSAINHFVLPLEDECYGVCAPRQLEDIDERDLRECVRKKLSDEENRLCEMLQQGAEEGLKIQEIAVRWGIPKQAFYKSRQRLEKKIHSVLYDATPLHHSHDPPADPRSG